MTPPPRSRVLIKIAVALVVLAVLGYLFMKSLDSARTEPYTVERAHLGPWTLELEAADGANAPLLSLRTGTGLVANLFTQMFNRTMESINRPADASIPIVLRGEFDRALSQRMKPGDLLTAAREAGIESASHQPRCLAHRRISEPGMTRQTYFAIVDSPSIVAFRARLASSGTSEFDAAALTPIMFVGTSDPAAHRWLPIRATDADCVAPIQIGAS